MTPYGPRLSDGEMTPRTEGNYCLTCGSYQCPHAHATYTRCDCVGGPHGGYTCAECQ